MKTRRQQILARRRVAVLAGLAALCLVTASACVFEEGTYQGGGRVDKGAGSTVEQPPAATDTAPTPQPTDTSSQPETGAPPNPIADAATG